MTQTRNPTRLTAVRYGRATRSRLARLRMSPPVSIARARVRVLRAGCPKNRDARQPGGLAWQR